MRGLLVVALIGCGGGSGPAGKDEVTCGASWDANPPIAGTCDEACAEVTAGTGAACGTGVQYTTGEITCPTTFEFEGERGCCFDLGLEGQLSARHEPTRRRRVFFLSCND